MDKETRLQLNEHRASLRVAEHLTEECLRRILALNERLTQPDAEAAEAAELALMQWQRKAETHIEQAKRSRAGIAELERLCNHDAAGSSDLLCLGCLEQSSDDDDPTPVDHQYIFVCRGCGRRDKRPATP